MKKDFLRLITVLVILTVVSQTAVYFTVGTHVRNGSVPTDILPGK